jgi:hypothetical protein
MICSYYILAICYADKYKAQGALELKKKNIVLQKSELI